MEPFSRELTDAINNYGSQASRDHLPGMGSEDWQGWVAYAMSHGVEQAVYAIDAHYAEEATT